MGYREIQDCVHSQDLPRRQTYIHAESGLSNQCCLGEKTVRRSLSLGTHYVQALSLHLFTSCPLWGILIKSKTRNETLIMIASVEICSICALCWGFQSLFWNLKAKSWLSYSSETLLTELTSKTWVKWCSKKKTQRKQETGSLGRPC